MSDLFLHISSALGTINLSDVPSLIGENTIWPIYAQSWQSGGGAASCIKSMYVIMVKKWESNELGY